MFTPNYSACKGVFMYILLCSMFFGVIINLSYSKKFKQSNARSNVMLMLERVSLVLSIIYNVYNHSKTYKIIITSKAVLFNI